MLIFDTDIASTDSLATITRTNRATLTPRTDGTILVTIEAGGGSTPPATRPETSPAPPSSARMDSRPKTVTGTS